MADDNWWDFSYGNQSADTGGGTDWFGGGGANWWDPGNWNLGGGTDWTNFGVPSGGDWDLQLQAPEAAAPQPAPAPEAPTATSFETPEPPPEMATAQLTPPAPEPAPIPEPEPTPPPAVPAPEPPAPAAGPEDLNAEWWRRTTGVNPFAPGGERASVPPNLGTAAQRFQARSPYTGASDVAALEPAWNPAEAAADLANPASGASTLAGLGKAALRRSGSEALRAAAKGGYLDPSGLMGIPGQIAGQVAGLPGQVASLFGGGPASAEEPGAAPAPEALARFRALERNPENLSEGWYQRYLNDARMNPMPGESPYGTAYIRSQADRLRNPQVAADLAHRNASHALFGQRLGPGSAVFSPGYNAAKWLAQNTARASGIPQGLDAAVGWMSGERGPALTQATPPSWNALKWGLRPFWGR